MTHTIAGLFPDAESAERAIVDLKNAGFGSDRIGVVLRDSREAAEMADEHGTATTEGGVAGSLIGITAGAVLAATGTLVIPGIGPFVSAGILATSLVGGAAGWLVGALVGLGIPKEEAQYYEDRVQRGSALVTVDAAEREHEARTILRGNGAETIEHRDAGDIASITRANSRSSVTADDLQREEIAAGCVPKHADTAGPRITDTSVERGIDVPLKGQEALMPKRAHDAEETRLHKEAVTKNEQIGDTTLRDRVAVAGAENDASYPVGQWEDAH